jgi:hypothetical protein
MGQQEAQRRRRSRTLWWGVAAAASLAACGTAQVDGDTGAGAGVTSEEDTSTSTSGTDLMTGQGMAIETPEAGVSLCLGPVAESYPPQCQGIPLLGLDWADVADRQTASGVTWGQVKVVGTFDGTTFTLTESPAVPTFSVEPDNGTGASPFPQLCDDPYRDGEEGFVPQTAEDMATMEAFGAFVEGYDGYVASWLSDGVSIYNVLVTGAADEAWADLRREWPGGLCVESRPEAATAETLLEAQEALSAAGIDGLQTTSPSTDGTLDVGVLVADQTTTDAVLRAVSGLLSADQVEVTGSLTPVEG